MLIIGELINSSRAEIKAALKARDESLIRKLARVQLEAGANALDLNAGTSMEREVEDLRWLVRIVQDELGDVRLSIDTPNPEAMAAGLELCKARPIVNSITNEEERKKEIILLIKEYDADVIGLTMGGRRIPRTVEDRLKEAEQLLKALDEAGINRERIFLDPLVMSIGSNQEQGRIVIEAVRSIKQEFGVKTLVGLSNVSFGLPGRSLINRTFLAMLLAAGLDAAILDPTNKEIIATLQAAEAILGKDHHCMKYIHHQRSDQRIKR
jgi:5-methyltetrahydrofolate--homocysteine methyltransferase